MARQNLSQAWTACLAILEEKQEVATQQKKARRSCFHLLHQEFFLLGLDPTISLKGFCDLIIKYESCNVWLH